MSDLGEVESLRLQLAMDRHSQFMTTLSNLLKKISDTVARGISTFGYPRSLNDPTACFRRLARLYALGRVYVIGRYNVARHLCRSRNAAWLSGRRLFNSISRLLLQNLDAAGTDRTRRRTELRFERKDDRRLRSGRLSGAIRKFWRDDIFGQSQRRSIPKGPWSENPAHSGAHVSVQSGSHLYQSFRGAKSKLTDIRHDC